VPACRLDGKLRPRYGSYPRDGKAEKKNIGKDEKNRSIVLTKIITSYLNVYRGVEWLLAEKRYKSVIN
jgi:hypothetical protein